MKDKIILAFDFGIKKIGVAIGQHITCTASPLMVLKNYNGKPNWYQISKIINDWKIEIIIVGLPLNMDGSEQYITFLTRNFVNQLNILFNLKIILHDERLSTIEAKSNLFKYKKYNILSKNNTIDTESAVVILESWFNNSF